MAKKDLPVYNIETFGHGGQAQAFYANTFSDHIRHHHFVKAAHKHDFFLVILFTKGRGTHDIDFHSYPIRPGALFVLSPGQTHNWTFSKDAEGYVFFHTRDFYDLSHTSEKIRDYPFFRTVHHLPLLHLKPKQHEKARPLFRELLREYEADEPMKLRKIRSLLTLLYVELSRIYLPGDAENADHPHYLDQVRRLEALIDQHYKEVKSPSAYALMMHVSERHLNRMSRSCLRKTISGLISDRVLLEAKRMLVSPGYTVAEVAAELGYDDQSYFSRLFKKCCGQTPTGFVAKYR